MKAAIGASVILAVSLLTDGVRAAPFDLLGAEETNPIMEATAASPDATALDIHTTVRTALGLNECPLYGTRYWQPPNSTTCFRFRARVTGDLFARSPSQPTDTIFRPQLFAAMESRTPTEAGTFRTYLSGRIVHDFKRSSGAGTATVDSDTETQQQQSGLDQAFIQFLGVTAGRTYSFFDADNGYTLSGARVSLRRVNLAAYTAYLLGDAFSITLSVEDQFDRRTFISGDPTVGYQQDVPDFVASARYLLTGARVQASFASHHLDVTNIAYPDRTGFAAQLGAAVYFPDISTPLADRLSVSAAYAEGAMSYLGFTNSVPDAVAVGGALFLTKGWNTSASYLHFWSPNWSSAITTGYASTSTGLLSPNFVSLNEWKTTANVVWRPSPEWLVGLEFQHAEQRTVATSSTRSRTERGQLRVSYGF